MLHLLRKVSIILLLVSLGMFFSAQAQKTIIKTNVPYWFSASPNLGVEFVVGDKLSVELSGGVNPFKFGDTKQLQHWIVWPEVRYWLNETFNGHFFGLHLVGGQYNMGGINIPIGKLSSLKDRRFQGSAFGAGASYGYQWMLNDTWGIELTLGVGYARFNYETFSLGKDGKKIGGNSRNYFGPTKGALSVVYIFE